MFTSWKSIISLIFLIFLFLLLSIFVYGIIGDIKGAPYVPTNKARLKILKKLLRRISKENINRIKFIDLGSGSGAVAFLASSLGYDVTGIEISPFLVAFCRIRGRNRTENEIKFYKGNLFNTDLSSYDIVFCYLMPKALKKLEQKLEEELGNNSYFISECFKLPNWKPIETAGNKKDGQFYLYKRPGM